MALPTNIVATPNTSLAGELPRTVTISGTNIFERPSYTDRELFTQTGSDTPNSNWNGSATKVDGIIGSAFSGNGSTAYIDLSSTLPDVSSNFIGVSCFFKTSNPSKVQTIFWIMQDSNNARIFDLTLDDSGLAITCTNGSYTAWSKTQKFDFTPQSGVWYHVFGYIDLNNSTNRAYIWLDGVEGTNQMYNNVQTSFGTPELMFVGTRENQYETRTDYFQGEICNLYISTNTNFKNHLDKYSNIPTVEVN